MSKSKSLFEKLSPSALGRGLWGRGPVPTRYKVLFLGQSLIFTMAIYIRNKDVEKAQLIQQKMADSEKQRAEMRGDKNE